MMVLRRFLMLGALVVAAATAGSAAAHDKKFHASQPLEPAAATAAQVVPPPLPLGIDGSFALVDHKGHAVSDRDFRGSYMLVFFGYANCPGICPTGLRAMTEAVDLLGAEAERVTPILITVDPAHDTPEALAKALPKIHPRLIGLTGTLERLSAAATGYKVSAKPVGRTFKGTPLIEHGSYIYLMGPDGDFLTLFPPIVAPETIAAALRRYMS